MNKIVTTDYSPLVTSAEMKRLDTNTIEYKGISSAELMLDASRALFTVIKKMQLANKNILILCGGGNNGGDGYALATLLASSYNDTYLVNLSNKVASNDAIYYRNLAVANPLIKEICVDQIPDIIESCSLVVDAVFGTGFRGSLSTQITDTFRIIDDSSAVKLAVDIPSGVYCDTAEVAPGAFKADITVTFEFLKPGLVSYPARDYCGNLKVVDIGFPLSIKNDVRFDAIQLNSRQVASYNNRYSKNTNKGNYGKILSVCGSKGMSGAAYLSAMGALRSGIGLFYLACEEQCLLPLQLKLTEPIFLPYKENIDEIGELSRYDCILHGCGSTTQRPEITEYLLKKCRNTIILDADALNNIAKHPELLSYLSCTAILTPHPGEMARLTGYTIAEVQSNRISCAIEYAAKTGCFVVLKGAATIIAEPNGRYAVNPTGNPGLAKGGSGDVLAGMIAAYCVNATDIFMAISAAVYEHGAAADRCLQHRSMQNLLPSDIVNEINR